MENTEDLLEGQQLDAQPTVINNLQAHSHTPTSLRWLVEHAEYSAILKECPKMKCRRCGHMIIDCKNQESNAQVNQKKGKVSVVKKKTSSSSKRPRMWLDS